MKKRLISAVMVITFIVSGFCFNGKTGEYAQINAYADESADGSVLNADFTASQIVNDIAAGWNLGNTLDAYDTYYSASYTVSGMETYWGNPVTTKAIIDAVHNEGFNAIRIPVTWSDFTDPDTYEIRDDWMDRVEEVVNFALDDDMYVIINVHHDTGTNGWLKASNTNIAAKKARFKKIWQQIAARFKNYDERLMFEGFNEIIDDDNEWNAPSSSNSEAAYSAVNSLNQIFVDTVRETGSVNAKRVLICNTYVASAYASVLSNFTLPVDTVSNKLIVEVHDYEPSDFTFPDSSVTWTAPTSTWGSDTDKTEMDNTMKNLSNYFVSKGIPVIIGEFGSTQKNNDEASRIKHAAYFAQTAEASGIKVFWWDNGNISGSGETMALLNRSSLQWVYPEIAQAFINGAGGKAGKVPGTTIVKKAIENGTAAVTAAPTAAVAQTSDSEKKDISDADVTINSIYTYTGKAIKALPKVEYGSVTLKYGSDYTLAYENNINTGEADVYIRGIGKYTDCIAASFVIVPKKAVIVSIKNGSSNTYLTFKKVKGASGYQYAYRLAGSSSYTLLKVSSAGGSSAVLKKVLS